MGPDYVRPHIETADKFRMAETEGQSIANLPWWELLHDEELQQLISQALLENKDLKQAVASVEELQARLATARMDFFPKMDANANAPAFGTLGGFLIRGVSHTLQLFWASHPELGTGYLGPDPPLQ